MVAMCLMVVVKLLLVVTFVEGGDGGKDVSGDVDGGGGVNDGRDSEDDIDSGNRCYYYLM